MSKICRFCLKTDADTYSSLETEEYKNQIAELIPELDINIVESPVICSNCNNILFIAHGFKVNCLRIEEQLKPYINTGETKINLEDVLNKWNEKPEEIISDVKFEVTEVEMSNYDEPLDDICFEEAIVPVPEVTKETRNAVSCKLCNKLYLKTSILEHMRTHINSKFICVTCTKGFDLKEGYITHNQIVHQDLTCNVCNRLFHKYANLQKHMRNHDTFGDFQCRACGLKTDSKASLEEHLLAHMGERLFECKYCKQSFSQSSMLTTHEETVHLTEKMCEFCGKSFVTKVAYAAHIKTHRKNFICKECGKCFRVASELKQHEKRHAGIKGKICEVCGKEFADTQTLKRHLRIHTGDMPYDCPICEKKFNTSFNKKVHLQSCMRKHGSSDGETSSKSTS